MKTMIIIIFILIILMQPVYSREKPFGPWDSKLVTVEKNPMISYTEVPSTASWMFNRFIRIFQIYISPQDGPNCRYSPTCSRYATECIDQYGIITGTIMAADRYMRCNPFGTWGKDLPQDNYIFK